MKSIFVNLSNHALSEKQIAKAKEQFGVNEFTNWSFPNVDPDQSSVEISKLAGEFVRDIFGSYKDVDKIIIHIMGEMTFTFKFVTSAMSYGKLKCVASTTERISTEKDGVKTSKFEFHSFREY